MSETIEQVPVGLDPRFVVDLKGRLFPMYAGVLDMATRSGLMELSTEILQIPTAENGGMAIVKACARFEDGRVFEDIGDASPASVKPLMVPAVLRMASTRAKGRVLRDAMNVGQALLEELGDEEAAPPQRVDRRTGEIHEAPPQRTPPQRATQTPATPPQSRPAPQEAPSASRAQVAEKYASWLEKAASLGALQSEPAVFNRLRAFNVYQVSEAEMKATCSELIQLVKRLETAAAEEGNATLGLAMDAAAGGEE